MSHMVAIGVRELRQNASKYLARVQAGETIEVTARGKVVARLVPAAADAWSELLDAGRINPPTSPDILEFEPLELAADVSAELRAMREDAR